MVQTGPDGGGSVARIDLGARSLTLLHGEPNPVGAIAIDAATGLYWTSPSAGTLSFQAKPGDPPTELRSGLRGPAAIAVDGAGRVYFAGQPASLPAGLFILDSGSLRLLSANGPIPTAIAVGAKGDVYGTIQSDGLVYRLGSDGRAEILLQGLDNPNAIAIDEAAGKLYFTEVPTPGRSADQGGRNTVNALDLGSRTRTVLHKGDSDPAGVAVAGDGSLYWTSARQGLVYRVTAGSPSRDENGGGAMKFDARLVGSEETPPVQTVATGQANFEPRTFEPDDDGEQQPGNPGPSLRFSLSAPKLESVKAALIHLGAPGQAGPVVAVLFDATVTGSSTQEEERRFFEIRGSLRQADLVGPLAGNWEGFTSALKSGQLYADVETAAHPDGEIRGQILPRTGVANRPPDGVITSPKKNVTIVAGQSVVFAGAVTDPDGDMVTVLWNFGDGTNSTVLNPGAHGYPNPGTFTVSFTATDSRGLSDPSSPHRVVTVTGGPGPTPTPTRTATPRPSMTATPIVTQTPTVPPAGTSTPTATPTPTRTLTPTQTPTVPPAGTSTPTPTPTPTRTLTPTSPPAVTLSTLQTTLFTPSCVGCHGAGGSAGLDLRAGQSFSNLVNVASTTQTGTRVIPFNPDQSVLVIQLASGHRSVSSANQNNIRSWILAGAPNN
ncbi:MAG: CHRD domain-containing protein [Thermoanaerobaculia bacterium]